MLLASALLVAIPEGFDIAKEGAFEPLLIGGAVLAGFLALLLLENEGLCLKCKFPAPPKEPFGIIEGCECELCNVNNFSKISLDN